MRDYRTFDTTTACGKLAASRSSPAPDASPGVNVSNPGSLSDALREARYSEALDLALALWAITPDPDLGRLCALIAAKLDPDESPADPWKAELEARGSVPVDVLIRALLPARTSEQLAERVEALGRRTYDPRIGVALEALLRAVPFTSSSARQNLARIFDAVGRLGARDPRFVGIAATLDADWNVREAQKEWMFKRFARVATAIDAAWPTVPRFDDPELLASWLATFAEADAPATTIGDLFDNVYAHPHDPGVRMVLQDALLEAGDPRGELMALASTGTDPARQQELIDAHGAEWLGEIAPFATVSEWRHGFPWRADVRFPQPRDVTNHGTHPLWRVIGDIRVEGDKVGPVLEPFLAHIAPTVKVLRSSGHRLVPLLAGRELPSIERLDLYAPNREEGLGLARTPLPTLRHLNLRTQEATWLGEAVWLDTLEVLELGGASVRLLASLWPDLVERRGLVAARSVRGTLSRGPDGRISALTLRPYQTKYSDPDRDRGRDTLPLALELLPDSALTSITVEEGTPDGWDTAVEPLIARSTRLRRAVVHGVERTFQRDGELVVEAPLPVLRPPEFAGAGPAGLWVAQDGQLLRVEPGTDTVLEAVDAGFVRAIASGEELAYSTMGTVTWVGRWQRSGMPYALRFGSPGLLAIGDLVEAVAADGTVLLSYTVGSQSFRGGDFSPEGDRVALTGWSSRLRIVPLGGGKAKMLGSSKRTRSVAWTRAGLWLAANEHDLWCMDDTGAVKREIPFRPFALQAWQDGVIAADGHEIRVYDAAGEEVMREPGVRGWGTEAGLVVMRAAIRGLPSPSDPPWFRTVPWR
ncbi:MAG: hypothetical protein R3F61_21215 [Myxococcota bacterium]